MLPVHLPFLSWQSRRDPFLSSVLLSWSTIRRAFWLPLRAPAPDHFARMRASSTSSVSIGLVRPTTSVRGVPVTSFFCHPTNTPVSPLLKALTAPTPNLVAKRRSKALGGAPRTTCPSVVARSSKPVLCLSASKYARILVAFSLPPPATPPIAWVLPRS